MMNTISPVISIFARIAACLLLCSSCNKYLDEPSDKSLVVPSTLEDLQALIDRPDKSTSGFSAAGEESSDDYYLTDNDYRALNYDYDQRRYRWYPENIWGDDGNEWYWIYFAIYGSNSVLDFLPGIPRAETAEGRYIKGQALVWRAFHYHDAAQIYTLPYDAGTADTDPGLPLRLNPNFNETSVRSNVAQTYEQIIKDLKEAIALLPTSPFNPYRASKQGAYGVLARTYLTMRDYDKAFLYADSCLKVYNTLLDFNEIDLNLNYPFPYLNKEVILQGGSYGTLFAPSIAKMQPDLYNMYQDDDLRKKGFFRLNTDGSLRFKGIYLGSSGVFNGITSAEMYLVRAEGYARQGQPGKAMDDLNTLLVKRWDNTKPFIPYTASSPAEALSLVLAERRRELTGRGLRWQDIRRLNKEGANITLKRTIEGVDYTLPPNDLRYALPIPENVIALSGMPQNPR